METPAKATSFPNWAKLQRDKGNYPAWRRHIIDVLQASGCEKAITEEFARLVYESDDSSSSSSGDDSDDAHQDFKRLNLGKHSHNPSLSQPAPLQEDQFERARRLYAAFQKKEKKGGKKKKGRRKREKQFEEKKKRMDATARTLINATIDSRGFASSTMDCKTAHQLWETLKPAEAYTEEEVQRSLNYIRIELCSNDMELVERMHDVVNKVEFILPKERKQYETRAVHAALNNLKQQHKLRFLDLIAHMKHTNSPRV